MAQTDFTISDVLAWARTKPADEAYEYVDFRNCAICQFLKETGRVADPAVSGNNWRDRAGGRYVTFDDAIRDAANNLRDNTFGGFATRLAALLPAEPLSATWTTADAYMADIELASA